MSGDLYEMATELDEAAQLDGAELGEWWASLAGLVPRVFDSASEEFREAFEKELRSEHNRLKTEFRIVKTVRTETVEYFDLRHESEFGD